MSHRRDRPAKGPLNAPALRPPGRPVETFTGPTGEPLPEAESKVLRAFVRDGRLRSIPAQATKRDVVLRYLLDRCFPEARIYPEKEVNQLLALFHPDVAALRRGLVDRGLMTRAAGEYRRAHVVDDRDGGPAAT